MDANSLTPDDNPLDYDTCLDPKWDGCGQRKPIDQFRPKSPLCKACERRQKDLNKQVAVVEASQKAALKEFGKTLLEQEKRKQLNLPALSAVAAGMVEKFGGLDQFLGAYYQQVCDAMQDNPGSKGTLDALYRITTLIERANAQEVTRDIPNMDDDDLSEVLVALARKTQQNIVEGHVNRPKIEATEEPE
jgi:hypothetical protein